MALVEWRDDPATGIASVDAEHRRLIDLINAGHTRAAGQGDAAPDAFLGELHDHIAAHFALEERIMREHQCAGYTAHKADHERLLETLSAARRAELERCFLVTAMDAAAASEGRESRN